MKAHTSTDETR